MRRDAALHCREEFAVSSGRKRVALADNMARVERVCLTGSRDGIKKTMWPTAYNSQSGGVCKSITSCHAPSMFKLCERLGANVSNAGFVSSWVGLERAPPGACFPPPGAKHVRRLVNSAALTGNIGHDLYNSWLDIFAQQEAGGGIGFFDVILFNVVWFKGWGSFAAAIKQPNARCDGE